MQSNHPDLHGSEKRVEVSRKYENLKLAHDLQKSTARHCIHKVKSPVSAISGYLELLTSSVSDGVDHHHIERYSKKINDGLHEVGFLLEQLHELYSFDEEETEVENPDIDLNWLAAEIAEIFNGSSELNAASVRLQPAGRQIFIRSNLTQIRMIIYNLIRIADRTLTTPCDILIRTEVRDKTAVVHISACKKDFARSTDTIPGGTTESDALPVSGIEISRRMASQLGGTLDNPAGKNDLILTLPLSPLS